MLTKYLGNFMGNPSAEMAPEQFDEKMMYTLNKELTKIKK